MTPIDSNTTRSDNGSIIAISTSEVIEAKENQSDKTTTAESGDDNKDDDVIPAVYQSSSFRGISLWLCPNTTGDKNSSSNDREKCKVGDFYQVIIKTLADEQGTYGDFIPHVTLVAALELTAEQIVEKVRNEIAPKIPPYAFEAEKVSFKDAYFQSVFVKLHANGPDGMVKRANELAKQVFPERQSDPPYMPHLSLVYGNLLKVQKQENIVPRLAKQLKDQREAAIIPIDAIQVWSTEGPVEEWFCIETIPLTGPKED